MTSYHDYEGAEYEYPPHEEEALTNEEWFCFLSTEEKAKWLSKHSQFMYNCGEKQAIPKIMYEEDFVQWLKERHE